jgi:hypothetical protein
MVVLDESLGACLGRSAAYMHLCESIGSNDLDGFVLVDTIRARN